MMNWFVQTLEWVLQPEHLLLWGLIAASIFLARGSVVTGRRIVYWLVLAVVFMGISPVDGWLITPLEDRFPRPASLPPDIKGILVLSGAENQAVSYSRGVPSLSEAADRLVEAAILARAYPELPIVYSGENTWPLDAEKNAFVARNIFGAFGVDSDRIAYEIKSQNTAESALLAQSLVSDTRGWLLVTSASHMPRAVGAFRAQGWEVLAFPVDYRTQQITSWGGLSFGYSSEMISMAIHEWGGLLWYRLSGRSSSFFPSP